MPPLVSVILPCYNAQHLVQQAIKSILHQTVNDLELIVVDDASTDGSMSSINSMLDSRITVLSLKTNVGYPFCMNEGIAIAKGKYIARMDADDICLPTRLEEQLAAFEKYPEASLCGLSRFRITPGGKMYADRDRSRQKYILETWDDLMKNQRLFTDPSVMLEKAKVNAVGGYRTFQRSGMDVDLWLRVMEVHGPCVTITNPLFGKRLEPGSLIFDPETFTVNQIPRILARQRKEHGSDDEQEGRKPDMNMYIQKGLILKGNERDKINLLYGAVITCLWFGDWIGVKVYLAQFRKLGMISSGGLLGMSFEIARKMFQRLRHNPYKRFTIPE